MAQYAVFVGARCGSSRQRTSFWGVVLGATVATRLQESSSETSFEALHPEWARVPHPIALSLCPAGAQGLGSSLL